MYRTPTHHTRRTAAILALTLTQAPPALARQAAAGSPPGLPCCSAVNVGVA